MNKFGKFAAACAAVVCAFGAFGALPDEYRQVDWVESNGQQWIDTGVVPDPTTVVEARFRLTGKDYYHIPIGNGVRTGFCLDMYTGLGFRFYPGGSYPIDNVVGNDYSFSFVPNEDGTTATVTMTNLTTGATGSVSSTIKNAQGASALGSATLGVFGTSSGQNCSYIRLHRLVIAQGGETVRDFIPCVKRSTAEAGLYDAIHGDFYGNLGTGARLGAGPDAFEPGALLVTADDTACAAGNSPAYGLTDGHEVGEPIALTAPASVAVGGKTLVCTGWIRTNLLTGERVAASTEDTKLLCAFDYDVPSKVEWKWSCDGETSATITFDGYLGESTLTNFPAFVRLTDGAGGFNVADCAAGAAGVRFTLGGDKELPSEVVRWNDNGICEFYVRVPLLKQGAKIKAEWGAGVTSARKGLSVWDETYTGVWRMEDDGVGIFDESPRGVHGYVYDAGTSPTVPGIVGSCRSFSATSYANLGNAAWSPTDLRHFTYECWFNYETLATETPVMGELKSLTYGEGQMIVIGTDGRVKIWPTTRGIGGASAAASAAPNTWNHCMMTYEGGVWTLYVNGLKQTGVSGIDVPVERTGTWIFHMGYAAYSWYNGAALKRDEARVSSVCRSADYAAAVHANIMDVMRFATVRPGFSGEGEDLEETAEETPAAAPVAPATTYYVKLGGDNAADGLSLATAWGTIDGAVAKVRTLSDEDPTILPAEILVDDGIHNLDGAACGAYGAVLDRAITVKALHGRGGVLVDLRGSSRKCKGFSLSSSDAVLDGLVITNGYGSRNDYGIGVSMSAGTVRNCLFDKGRYSYSSCDVALSGGIVSNCVFRGVRMSGSNSDAYSSSIALSGGGLIDHCVITGNTQVVQGAVYVSGSGRIRNTLFANNTCVSGSGRAEIERSGAGLAYTQSAGQSGAFGCLIVENCTFADNVAPYRGGAVYAGNVGCVLVNCAFGGNSVPLAADGLDHYGPLAVNHSISRDVSAQNNCVVGEASFVGAPTNYAAKATSISRDLGRTYGWMADATDLAGNPRVGGVTVDAGAYEYVSTGDEELEVNVKIDGPTDGRNTLTVPFTSVVSDASNLVYAWDFGDGAMSDLANPTHTYAAPGYYDVRLVVSNTVTKKTAEYFKEGLVKVTGDVVYVAPAGASTPTEPYTTPKTAAETLFDARRMNPDKVILLEGTITIYNDAMTFPDKVEIVGQGIGKTTLNGTVSLTLAGSGSTFHGLTVKVANEVTALTAGAGVTVSNCLFTSNGAAYNFSQGLAANGATVRDCVFRSIVRNYRPAPSAISIGAGGTLVENCVITNNSSANNYNSNYAVGAIHVTGDYTPAPIIRNCLIANNKITSNVAPNRGAGIDAEGRVVVENCTIVSNTAPTGVGLGLYAGANSVVRNTLVWGNALPEGVCEVRVGASSTLSSCSVSNVTALAADETITLERCQSADPKLNLGQKPKLPYYSILSSSPCKNAGKKDGWMEGTTDLVGNPRVFGGKPDIGCYENQTGGMLLIVR